mgnify:CR=1 FL=1
MLRGEAYTEKVDIYSFGVILYEMLTGKDFFGDLAFMSQLEDRVKAGKRPSLPPDCVCPAYNDLMDAYVHLSFSSLTVSLSINI